MILKTLLCFLFGQRKTEKYYVTVLYSTKLQIIYCTVLNFLTTLLKIWIIIFCVLYNKTNLITVSLTILDRLLHLKIFRNTIEMDFFTHIISLEKNCTHKKPISLVYNDYIRLQATDSHSPVPQTYCLHCRGEKVKLNLVSKLHPSWIISLKITLFFSYTHNTIIRVF